LLGKIFSRSETRGAPQKSKPFHPHRLLCDWDNGDGVRISDATTGVAVFGSTGSGKTSGIGRHLALAYLTARFGGLVLCAKKEERAQWEKWAAEAHRSDDLVIIDAGGNWRFNPLEWEASRSGEGAGLAINIVALLDEMAGAIAGTSGGGEGGDNRFFVDALHHMNTYLVDLPLLAGLEVSLPLLRAIVNTAPQSQEEARSQAWRGGAGECAAILAEADKATAEGDPEIRADFVECRDYWLATFPNLSERTRSIIVLLFLMLARPFNARPLRRLFSADTNITPESAFDGKIIVVDLCVQEFRLAGKLANLAWKYCFQIAVMRRPPAVADDHLRPVFLWADEAQNFVTTFDAEYQAVARSAGGCTVYLTQNRESYLRALGSASAVDSLLGNLQIKAFCQQSSPDTNAWASRLLGERWSKILSTNIGRSGPATEDRHVASHVNTSEQRRFFVETAEYTVLRRGGPANQFEVEVIVYLGGHIFSDELPFRRLRIDQRSAHVVVDG
jgi:hypothetical protein